MTAAASGTRLLELAADLETGFGNLVCRQREHSYGIQPAFSVEMLRGAPSHADAVAAGLVTNSYASGFYGRSLRVGADVRELAEQRLLPFQNTREARLLSLARAEETLVLSLAETSYLTMLGTNSSLSGYVHSGDAFGESPALGHNWTDAADWRAGLAVSQLANVPTVCVLLTNGGELFYVRRRGLDRDAGSFSGVTALLTPAGHPLALDQAARNAVTAAIGLTVSPAQLVWLAAAADRAQARPDFHCVCRVEAGLADLQSLIRTRDLAGTEGGEEVFSCPLPGSQSELRQLLAEKVVGRSELRTGLVHRQATGIWEPRGATALLLTLAHLLGEQAVAEAIETA